MALQHLFDRLNSLALSSLGEKGGVLVDGVPRTADFVMPGDVQFLGGVSADIQQPYLVMLSAEVPDEPEGKIVVARALNWRIATPITPDGYGYTKMSLERVA